MTTLILLLPQRQHLHAQGRESTVPDGAARSDTGPEYDYLLSPDGRQIGAQGRSPVALLPKAQTVVVLPADADIAWHRISLPRAGRQMREALAGQMEEQLLDDPEHLAFALEAGAAGGAEAWVAVLNKAWLQQHLGVLDQAQIFVDRVLPQIWPQAQAQGHFFAQTDASQRLGLCLGHAQGLTTLSLDGSLTRELLGQAALGPVQWTAEPGVVAAAEQWLGSAVAPLGRAERALAALASPWELRQFELAPKARGLRALRQSWRSVMGPAWRPVRWGLAGLLLVQLLGLNLLAWQQQRTLDSRRAAITQTLRDTFPQVRAILDAPLQMRREADLLRANAGRAGEQDLEVLLAAAATAWPPDRGPADALSFETGRLMFPAAGWSEPQIEQFRQQLSSEGWQLEVADGRLALSRARQP